MPVKKPKKIQLGPYHADPHRPPIKTCSYWAWRLYFFEAGRRVAPVMPDGTKASGRFSRQEARERLTELFRFNPAPTTATGKETVSTIGNLSVRYQAARDADGELRDTSKRHYRAKLALLRDAGVAPWSLDVLEDLERVIELRDRLRAMPLAMSTVAQVMKVLRMMLCWGVEANLTRPISLPTHKRLGLSRVKSPVKPTPSRETVAALLAAVDPSTEVGGVIRLLADFGARIGEVVGLEDHHISADLGTVVLDGKTGPRTVPVPAGSRALLAELRSGTAANGGRVFATKPGSLRTTVNKSLGRACDALGVERFSSHGFRRRKATDLLASGIAPRDYEAFMGHSYQVGLDIYAQVDPVGMRRHVEGVSFSVLDGDDDDPDDDGSPSGGGSPPAGGGGALGGGNGLSEATGPGGATARGLDRPTGLSRSPREPRAGRRNVVLPVGVLPALRAVVPVRTGSR